ncbi:hypothetical protein ACRALDRAFT_210878 [Sodiomyces alcalophilus JCM 7366]|uniref:uncharacterized protein n=1 Tax=Sodiomyces alcalophilus JCM 7366 TaxID=591952 RepID=UPI0039B63A40
MVSRTQMGLVKMTIETNVGYQCLNQATGQHVSIVNRLRGSTSNRGVGKFGEIERYGSSVLSPFPGPSRSLPYSSRETKAQAWVFSIRTSTIVSVYTIHNRYDWGNSRELQAWRQDLCVYSVPSRCLRHSPEELRLFVWLPVEASHAAVTSKDIAATACDRRWGGDNLTEPWDGRNVKLSTPQNRTGRMNP